MSNVMCVLSSGPIGYRFKNSGYSRHFGNSKPNFMKQSLNSMMFKKISRLMILLQNFEFFIIASDVCDVFGN